MLYYNHCVAFVNKLIDYFHQNPYVLKMKSCCWLIENEESLTCIFFGKFRYNLDVVKCADWIIDLGPGGGREGGCIMAEGTPEDFIKSDTPTSAFLKQELQ